MENEFVPLIDMTPEVIQTRIYLHRRMCSRCEKDGKAKCPLDEVKGLQEAESVDVDLLVKNALRLLCARTIFAFWGDD